MTDIDWRLLPGAAYAYDASKTPDIMHVFREMAYAGGIPWQMGRTIFNGETVRVLLKSMAATLTTNSELHKVFVFMDEARQHGFAWSTADAGDILIARAEKKRGTEPLPFGWEDQAAVAAGRGKNSSGAYWGAAMLRAAGHHVDIGKPHDQGEPDLGVA
jgi:hypothetical protein